MATQLNPLTRLGSLTIAGLVIALDRVTKIQIKTSMTAYDSFDVIPGWFRIIHTENPGAAFSMLADGNPIVRAVVLIGVSLAVSIFVAWALWSEKSSLKTWLTRLGLSLILGGAIGNLYDRIVHRTVTDFIEIFHGSWAFPAFNVADSAITVGAILLLFDLWRENPKTYGESANIERQYSKR